MTSRLDAKGLYLTGIKEGRPAEAAAAHVGERYTQHSTGVRDGVDGFVAFVTDFATRHPDRDIRIVRGVEDGRFVALHAHQVLDGSATQWVTIDFFDTDDEGRVVEHWDVIAPYAPSTPSGHTSVDGPTEVLDLDRTAANKALVRRLIEDVLMPGGNPGKVREYISAAQYLQHNAEVPDGLEPFAALATAPDKPLIYDEIVLLVGQGNLVWTLSRARWRAPPMRRPTSSASKAARWSSTGTPQRRSGPGRRGSTPASSDRG